MKSIYKLFICSMVIGTITGCKKYLDVTPKSSLSENELFASETGFQQALSGIYSQMATRSMYGDNLSMGFISALGQNYATQGNTAPFVQTRDFMYNSDEVINYTTNIWNGSYSAIAGLNRIISNTTEHRNVLSTTGYNLVKGEALGLRAYLHFELLRVFGNSFAVNAAAKAIPYKTIADQFSKVPSTTKEATELALQDLTEAASLLKETDPIVSGATNRRTHMNYYAVKALEARIRLYSGDKPGAAAAAKVVVESGAFPFVTEAAIGNTAGFKDRLFITENVFGLRVRTIKDWSDIYFKYRGSSAWGLTRSESDINSLYEVTSGGGTDIRYNYLFEYDGGARFPSKFWQTYTSTSTLDDNRLDQLVPLIRVSEMYYILAETAQSPASGLEYLNVVRGNRALPDLVFSNLTSTVLQEQIMKEYQKEFYAEGQLFFYYKRLNSTKMQFRADPVSADKYKLPIPASELEFNPNY